VPEAGHAFAVNSRQDAKSVALPPSMVTAVMLKVVTTGLFSAQKSENPTAVPTKVAPAVAAPYLNYEARM